MSVEKKKKLNPGWVAVIVLSALIIFSILLMYLLDGKNIALFNPKGLVAQEQHNLMIFVGVMLLIIAIPTLILLFVTAWKYRESNTKALHTPNPRRSKYLDLFMWGVPAVFMVVISTVMWFATHRLVPQKLIAADAKPIRIQVISMRWKWLFIYPEQKFATVNFVQIPVNTPVQFELTADEAPMSSFWIPNLGGQLYTMTSHVNRLNLMADTLGDYPGSSAEINGAGFAGMKFTARISTSSDFDVWVKEVKRSPNKLDTTEYKRVLAPSENNPIALYSDYQYDIYNNVLAKYAGSHDHYPTEYEAH